MLRSNERKKLKKLGLIAGSGPLPLLFAREAKGESTVVAVALSGYTSPELEGLVDKICWVKLGELDRAIKFLLSEGVKQAVMAGKIPQSVLLSRTGFTEETTLLLDKLSSKQTESVLMAVTGELEKRGINLIDGREYLSSSLVTRGVLTQRQPTEGELKDIEFGKMMVKEIGRLDIGQMVVVKRGIVLAVEAIEGTDEAIRRGADWGGERVVIVKMSKPQQNMRFDIPVVGKETLQLLKEIKAAVLAIEAEKTVILNKEESLKIADEAGICVIAL